MKAGKSSVMLQLSTELSTVTCDRGQESGKNVERFFFKFGSRDRC